MSFLSAQNLFYPISERFGGIFGNFSNFSFFWSFSEFFGLKNRRKKVSRKMSFFSAQNWFYPISERFGGIFGNFSNFSFFFEIFPSFLVWKIGEKNVIF